MSRKRRQETENHERWLVSYADFITLLFAFFVVMFATSQTDRSKAQQVSDSVNKALAGQSFSAAVSTVLGGTVDSRGQGNAQMKGPGGANKTSKASSQTAELLPSMKLLQKQLEQEIKSGRIEVSMQARGLTISFQQAALFPSGGDEIAPDTLPSIEKIAQSIRLIPNPVRLEGHTDAIPIHNSRFRSNWDLSAARSIALLELLTSYFGIPREKLSIAGYAETAPVASNDTDQGRARNRRVDIVLLNQTGILGEPDRFSAK